MSQRPFKPEAVPGLMPFIFATSPRAALKFYEQAFGFEPVQPMIERDGEIEHAEMSFHDVRIMIGPEKSTQGEVNTPKNSGCRPGMSLYVYCDDVDTLYARAIDCGAQPLEAPATMFWGDRMCRLVDLDGYEWSFATNVADFDPANIPS